MRKPNRITLSLLANESFEILLKLAYLTDEPQIVKQTANELRLKSNEIYSRFTKRISKSIKTKNPDN